MNEIDKQILECKKNIKLKHHPDVYRAVLKILREVKKIRKGVLK